MTSKKSKCYVCNGRSEYRLGVCSFCLSGLEKLTKRKKVDKVKKNNVKPKNPLLFGKGIERYFKLKESRNERKD